MKQAVDLVLPQHADHLYVFGLAAILCERCVRSSYDAQCTNSYRRDVVARVHHRVVHPMVGQDQEAKMVHEIQLCVLLILPEMSPQTNY
jgi:hypothetical protein